MPKKEDSLPLPYWYRRKRRVFSCPFAAKKHIFLHFAFWVLFPYLFLYCMCGKNPCFLGISVVKSRVRNYPSFFCKNRQNPSPDLPKKKGFS